jgi:RNA polymerase sigma-70 factor (ECF subfamily)
MSQEASQEEDRQEEDRRLLARAQEGDVSAFEALVGLHQDRVYGLALRMTRSEADAAEITQDTFLSAYQHLKDFRGEAAFGSWVHRIAANHALMRLRHRRVAQAAEAELHSRSGAPWRTTPSRTGAGTPRRRRWTRSWGRPSSKRPTACRRATGKSSS